MSARAVAHRFEFGPCSTGAELGCSVLVEQDGEAQLGQPLHELLLGDGDVLLVRRSEGAVPEKDNRPVLGAGLLELCQPPLQFDSLLAEIC